MFGYDADDLRRDDRGVQRPPAPRRPDAGDRRPAGLHRHLRRVRRRVPGRPCRTGRPAGCTRAAGRSPAPDGAAARVLGAAYDTTGAADGRRAGHPGAGGDAGRLLQPRPRMAVHLRQRRGRAAAGAHAARTCSARCSGRLSRRRSAATSRRTTAPPCGPALPVSFDAYYPAPLDGWYELRAWPSPDGLSVYFLEVTERRQVQEQAERAARAAGPPGPGELRARRHPRRRGRDRAPAAASSCRRSPTSASSPSSVPTAAPGTSAPGTSTRPAAPCWRAYAEVRLDAMPIDRARGPRPAHRGAGHLLRRRGARRAAAGAGPGTARAAGAVDRGGAAAACPRADHRRCSRCSTRPATSPSADDIAVAQDVADRAGLALDNARLYSAQQQLAEGLQRSLLTEPPEPDHAEIAVRYLPAAEAARVGGDWYDAFLQPGGATMLVIGDVVGHDTEAAAAMGQLRGLLRGIATTATPARSRCCAGWTPRWRPCRPGTLATAAIARFEQTRRRAGARGHPDAVGQRRPSAAAGHQSRRHRRGAGHAGEATCCWASTRTPAGGSRW